MESFDAGFISATEAKKFGKFSNARDMDKFIIEHGIPLLSGGSGKFNYRVHKPSLNSALLKAHSFKLQKARTTPPSKELSAWRKANGAVLALRNAISKEKDAGKVKSLKEQLGGKTTKARNLYKEYKATKG